MSSVLVCGGVWGGSHLEFLPEFCISIFVALWNGHIVVFPFFLVQQLVPVNDTSKKEVGVLFQYPMGAQPYSTSNQAASRSTSWADTTSSALLGIRVSRHPGFGSTGGLGALLTIRLPASSLALKHRRKAIP